MSLRWKLNALMLAMVALFLVAAAFSIRAVRRHSEHAQMYSRMRTQAQFTADVRALLYQHLAAQDSRITWPFGLADESWPEFLLRDLEVQIRLADDARESKLWSELHETIRELNKAEQSDGNLADIATIVNRAESTLRHLRNHYERVQNELSVRGARSSLVQYVALWIACIVVTIILLVHLIAVRDWMVKPIEQLGESIRAIGKGQLDHRIPVRGSDEISTLAHGINDMSEELARRQAALIEARELGAIGELCANIAHGLRNPLATIRATAQLAQRRSQQGKDATDLMGELTTQADRMDQRITRLFEFSRTVGLHCTDVTFAELAAQVRVQVTPQLNEKSMTLEIEDRAEASRWSLDQAQIVESIGELVSNGIHHSKNGSMVRVVGEHVPAHNGSGPTLRISVVDQGAGMDENTLQKAFDPFFTSRPSGIGMGLPLVRRIISRHGGTVEAQSQLDHGTQIAITLGNAKPLG